MPITLTGGGFKDALGATISGTLILTLSDDAKLSGSANQIVPRLVVATVTSGNISGSPSLYGTDEFTVSGLYYTAVLIDSNTNPVWGPQLWQPTGGGSLDVGSLTPLSARPTISVNQVEVATVIADTFKLDRTNEDVSLTRTGANAATFGSGDTITFDTLTTTNATVSVAGGSSNLHRRLGKDNSDHSVTGTTSETDLVSVSITGGAMGATGALHIVGAGTITGAVSTKRIRLYLGSTLISDTGAASGTSDWYVDCWIYNTSASAQRATFVRGEINAATAQAHDYTTASVDTSVTQTVKISGQLGNAADTITTTLFNVWVVQG